MAFKITAWSEGDFRKNCGQRRRYAMDYRKNLVEAQWRINELIYYNKELESQRNTTVTAADLETSDDDDFGVSVRDVAINYVFRDVRYMHAQMSANPPTVKVIPASVDANDEERAESADLFCRWAREEHDLQEVVDSRNLKTLTKGIGYIRPIWDSTLGDVMLFGEEDGLKKDELIMSGDFKVYSPSSWDIWLDPDAKTPHGKADGVVWFFEKISVPVDYAGMRWPEHTEAIKTHATSGKSGAWKFWGRDEEKKNTQGVPSVDVFIYTEKGMATNGMRGRYCAMLGDSEDTILEHGENPNPDASLGLDILTDIDVEDRVYAKSIIEYLDNIQSVIQSLDANTLQNLVAHNTIRMYVTDEAEINDEGVTNSGVDIIRGAPGQAPQFLQPPSMMPDGWRFRDQLNAGRGEVSMINEAMLGQSSRETSGFTTQLQVNQGNMGRRRLFNKFSASTKHVYKMLLAEAIQNWDDARLVKVLGEERAYMSRELRGADIDGGYDLIAEYGQNFSLDPNTARDQLMQLMPLFEKIPGFDYHSLVEGIRLNVMDNFVDKFGLARRKQRKIFKKMIHSFEKAGVSAYIKPHQKEDHQNMINYGNVFIMTSEYENLDDGLKKLIDQHVSEREDILATRAADAAKAAAPAPGPAGPPMPPGLPQLPGM